MQGAADHIVHAFELLRGAELNFPEHDAHGNYYLDKDLMIQIFNQAVSIVLALLSLQRFDPVGVEYRQNDGNEENHHQSGEGKIFYQPKRLDSLF